MELKFYGLMILQDYLLTFHNVKDSDIEDHKILEQYHAQFTSALSPMFNKRSPDALLASACLVNVTFISFINDVILMDKQILLLMTQFQRTLHQSITTEYHQSCIINS